ncbi:MAG: hypothetical protein SVR94_05135, partial [Pseudomonadota bacterium]|nr:hypothetical protein [Pseudomonadota bacterium]
MSQLEAMQKATDMTEAVYKTFLQQVVSQKVLADRKGQPSEETKKRISKGTHINHLPIRLMTLSGKGGWHPDPQKRASYGANMNITLLDHLLSVTRGSLMLAALDWLNQTPAMDNDYLRKKLTVIAAIAFLHDADKDLFLELQQAAQKQGQHLNTSREIELTPAHLATLMQRYGIAEFLATVDVSLTADQILYLLEKVEATQSHRHPPSTLPPRDFEKLPHYVRLADKLDGIWVAADREKKGVLKKGGLEGVLQRLETDQGCLDANSWLRRDWHKIDVFDPHHPFLLDELQRWLAVFSRRLAGVLPLLETHQDGRLLMLLPGSQWEAIKKRAIDKLCRDLPFQLKLVISKPGVPALYNAQPTHEELEDFINNLPHRDLSQLLRIKSSYQTEFMGRLDELLHPLGLQPRLPKKAQGQLVTLYQDFEYLDIERLRRAAHAVLLMNLNLEVKPKDNIPDYKRREAALVAAVGEPRLAWIDAIEHEYSRRVITALWAISIERDEVQDAIWGEEGLLKQWLEGDAEQAGFNQFITGRGAEVIAGVKRHFDQLLAGQRLFPEDENLQGRCLFTDEPVAFEQNIDEALGLYGVKVSAFSGRDNRPEALTSDKAHTNVSPVSIAEHSLRARAHQQQGGREGGVPTLITSPMTVGLFGGLVLTDDKAMQAMSLYDLSRLEIKKGNVYHGVEVYQQRYRLARLETLSEKTVDQVNQLRLMLQACVRMGRPLHVFRGLPTLQRAFFYYDAMPQLLAELLDDLTDSGLRLEQIPTAIQRLETAQILLDTKVLGYETLRLYVYAPTRLGAICLAWGHFNDVLRDQANRPETKRWRSMRERFYRDYLEGKTKMTSDQAALVQLGQK